MDNHSLPQEIRAGACDYYQGRAANILKWIEGHEFSLVRGDRRYRGKVVRAPIDQGNLLQQLFSLVRGHKNQRQVVGDPSSEYWCIQLENENEPSHWGTVLEILQWIEGCEVAISGISDSGPLSVENDFLGLPPLRRTKDQGKIVRGPDGEWWYVLLDYV